MISSLIPSLKYSCSGSPLMLANGRTQIESLRTAGWASATLGSRRVATHKFGDAGGDLAPAGRVEVAGPAGHVGALDAVEGPGELCAVDRQLDQLVIGAGSVRLRLHPLGLHRFSRPDDHDRLGRLQPFLDHLGISPMRRQLIVPPDAVAQPAQGLGDLLGLIRRRAGVGDEDVGHAHATPPWSPP